MARARFALLAGMIIFVAGCRPVYFGDAVPYPEGCKLLGRDAAHCAALVDAARAELGLLPPDIAEVHLLTEDRCEADRSILCKRSGNLALPVRFTLSERVVPMGRPLVHDRRPETVLLGASWRPQ